MKRVPKLVWVAVVACLIVGGIYWVWQNTKVITSISGGPADDK